MVFILILYMIDNKGVFDETSPIFIRIGNSFFLSPIHYTPSQLNIYHFPLFYFQVEGELFIVPDASHEFTLMISDYCELCSLLPSISVELGLRTAELMKFFNSRICQLIIGNEWFQSVNL